MAPSNGGRFGRANEQRDLKGRRTGVMSLGLVWARRRELRSSFPDSSLPYLTRFAALVGGQAGSMRRVGSGSLGSRLVRIRLGGFGGFACLDVSVGVGWLVGALDVKRIVD